MPNQSTTIAGIAHGENRGYQRHYKLKIPIDDLDSCGCRRAHAEYVAASRGGVKRMSAARERDLIRSRAFYVLSRQFPQAFKLILAKESERRRLELLRLENVDRA